MGWISCVAKMWRRWPALLALVLVLLVAVASASRRAEHAEVDEESEEEEDMRHMEYQLWEGNPQDVIDVVNRMAPPNHPDFEIDLDGAFFSSDPGLPEEFYSIPNPDDCESVPASDLQLVGDRQERFLKQRQSCLKAQHRELETLKEHAHDLRMCHDSLQVFINASDKSKQVEALLNLHTCRRSVSLTCREGAESLPIIYCYPFMRRRAKFAKTLTGKEIRSIDKDRRNARIAVASSACHLDQHMVAHLPSYDMVMRACEEEGDYFHLCVVAAVVGCPMDGDFFRSDDERRECREMLHKLHMNHRQEGRMRHAQMHHPSLLRRSEWADASTPPSTRPLVASDGDEVSLSVRSKSTGNEAGRLSRADVEEWRRRVEHRTGDDTIPQSSLSAKV